MPRSSAERTLLPKNPGVFEKLTDRLGRIGDRDPGDPAGIVDRFFSLTTALAGLLFLGMQVFWLYTSDLSNHGAHFLDWYSTMSIGVIIIVSVVQYALFQRCATASWLSALMLVILTVLMWWEGESYRLPDSVYGPQIIYFMLVVGLEWKLAWPLVFILLYGLIMPLTAGSSSWVEVVCAQAILLSHGFGVRYAAAAIQRYELGVDDVGQQARATASLAREHSVLLLQRQAWDAFVHDHVINVLRSAEQAQQDEKGWLRAEANRALALMEQRGVQEHEVDAEEIRRRVLAVVQGILPWAEVVMFPASPRLRLPSAVLSTMLPAMGEALRNAERHSGAENVGVLVSLASDHLAITVTDDGTGFEPRSIPETALGLRTSIRGRMGGPGFSSVVDTAEGQGTSVRLSWVRLVAEPASRSRRGGL